MRVVKSIDLDAKAEQELRALAVGKRVEVRVQQRARIVMLAAKGMQNKDIALEVGLDRRQVALWRGRFLEGGIDALRKDAPRTGRPASVMQKMESRIVQTTLAEIPTDATHWSTRTLAAHLGVGATTVRKAWRNNGLKPHLSRSFKLSNRSAMMVARISLCNLTPDRVTAQAQAAPSRAPVVSLRPAAFATPAG